MVNYGNGKIYKVICSATGRVYIGSTTVPLSKRMTAHRWEHNQCMTKDFIDGKIFLIEDYPCERKEQLLMRERFHIESMKCVNKCRPIITNEETIESKKEYYQDNKEKICKKMKEYQKDNKDKIREYNEKHKERKKKYNKDYREDHKDYFKNKRKDYQQKNKETIKKTSKEYYQNNKDQLNEKQREKISCECGSNYSRSGKSRHFKTEKHIKFSHSLQTSEPSDACPSPSVSVP